VNPHPRFLVGQNERVWGGNIYVRFSIENNTVYATFDFGGTRILFLLVERVRRQAKSQSVSNPFHWVADIFACGGKRLYSPFGKWQKQALFVLFWKPHEI